MKLALGTVQFGLDYGIANRSGQIDLEEARRIVAAAAQAGVTTLDTAAGYGDSEERLGRIGVDSFAVISKLPGLPVSGDDVLPWARSVLAQSLKNLRRDRIDALMMHKASDLTGSEGEWVYAALKTLKDEGSVGKIGVSVYQPADLEACFARFDLDIVQAPFNVIDRRLQQSGWLDRLAHRGVEVHSRSAFLQGLLLLPLEEQIQRFGQWTAIWQLWHHWLDETGQTALQAALGFALGTVGIDQVVVGVDSLGQFRQLLEHTQHPPYSPPHELSVADDSLVNPSLWERMAG